MIRSAIAAFFLCALGCLLASPVPLTIKEMSLMLRSGYSSDVVLQELSKRKFADNLDAAAEEQLVKVGATKSLINTLESGVYQLSAAEIANEQQKQAARREVVPQSAPEPQRTNPTAPAPPASVQIGGTMYDHFKDDLVYWHEGSLVPVDDEALQKKKFYLLFFSAIWSKSGRQVTSKLVDYYNRVEPHHPEFEVVFFSVDRSAFAMENYISQMNMPWAVLAYDKRNGKAGAIQQSLVKQVPLLVLAEASGKILSQSGDDEASFDKVLTETDRALQNAATAAMAGR